MRDGDCVYNIKKKKKQPTKELGFNSKAVNPFAFLFKEERIEFGQEFSAPLQWKAPNGVRGETSVSSHVCFQG